MAAALVSNCRTRSITVCYCQREILRFCSSTDFAAKKDTQRKERGIHGQKVPKVSLGILVDVLQCPPGTQGTMPYCGALRDSAGVLRR